MRRRPVPRPATVTMFADIHTRLHSSVLGYMRVSKDVLEGLLPMPLRYSHMRMVRIL